MTVQTVETFYGILALVAFAFVIGIVVLGLLAVVSEAAADAFDAVAEAIAPNALAMGWIVAFLATAGSLYFSEVAHFEPCTLCWYQRIAMYPLVVILGIAVARRDTAGALYAAGLAGIGAVIAAYHVALEWFPALDSGTCDPDNPCTLVWFRVFGFVSLPTLALAAFLLILTFCLVRLRRSS
jgi:disulfide bond formation protein DsbB